MAFEDSRDDEIQRGDWERSIFDGTHIDLLIFCSHKQTMTSFAFRLIASAKRCKSNKTCSIFKAGRQLSTKSFDLKSSSTFKLVVASVDWKLYVKSNKMGCAFLSIACAESNYQLKPLYKNRTSKFLAEHLSFFKLLLRQHRS